MSFDINRIVSEIFEMQKLWQHGTIVRLD